MKIIAEIEVTPEVKRWAKRPVTPSEPALYQIQGSILKQLEQYQKPKLPGRINSDDMAKTLNEYCAEMTFKYNQLIDYLEAHENNS